MRYVDESEYFEDPQPDDRKMCSKFGAGAFPCGAPYKVQVRTITMVGRDPQVRRRVLCRAHYEFFISQVPGGAGGLKGKAMAAAYEELAAAHREEFQAIFERAVARLLGEQVPDLDPSHVLPSRQES